jgi:hypothetical protein
MSRIIRLLVERSMPVEYLESTLPIDYGKAVLRRQARADDRVNSQLQISCGAIHHPKLSHQARADHWHNKSSNGVGLGGDSSPRMIAFQARLEF